MFKCLLRVFIWFAAWDYNAVEQQVIVTVDLASIPSIPRSRDEDDSEVAAIREAVGARVNHEGLLRRPGKRVSSDSLSLMAHSVGLKSVECSFQNNQLPARG